MTPYQRIFGTGPRGTVASLATLALAVPLDRRFMLPPLHGNAALGIAALIVGAVVTALIVGWSARVLPAGARGRELVTTGPYRYVRHPIYAAFLGPFDLGLALALGSWIFVAWAAVQYPIWRWNVAAEERLMHRTFGEAYEEYCRRTSRFIPTFAALCASPRD